MPINKKTWLLGYPPYKIARPSAEITLTVNGQNKENGQTFTPPNLLQGTTVQYTVTALNGGTNNLILANATRSGAVKDPVTAWSSNTLIPGASATCTITLDTSTLGQVTGGDDYFEFATNDLSGGEDVYRVNVSYEVLNEFNYYNEITNPNILVLRNEATSGATEINHGTGATALNASILGGVTLGQSIGSSPAFDFNGADGRLTIANHALLANMTTQRWAFMVRPDNLGELNFGVFFCWGSGAGHIMRFGANNTLFCLIKTNGTNAQVSTNNNQIQNLIGANGWIFMDYDDTNAAGNGRKIRLWKAVGGVLSLLTLATNIAAIGTVTNQATTLFLANRSDLALSFDGKQGETIANNSLWTTPEMQAIVDKGGV